MKKLLVISLILSIFTGCSLGLKGKLTIYSYRPEFSRALKKVIEAFNKQHKLVEIVIDEVRNDAMPILDARFRNETAPDILMVPNYKKIKEYAKDGYIKDLSEMKYNTKVGNNLSKGYKYNEKIYGFPMNVRSFGIIYNKDIFDKNNLGIPKTAEELRHVCLVLANNGVTPFAPSIKDSWPLGFIYAMGHAAIMENNEAAWIESMNTGIGSFKSSKADGIFNILNLYRDNSGVKISDSTYRSQTADFAEGKAAMIIQNFQSYNMIKSIKNGRYGYFAIPFMDEGTPRLFMDVETVLAVNAKLKKTKIAAAFLEFLSSNEAQIIIMKESTIIPPFKNTPIDNKDKIYSDLYSYINNDMTMPWTFNKWPVSVFESSKSIIAEYMTGKRNQSEVYEKMDEIWGRSVAKKK